MFHKNKKLGVGLITLTTAVAIVLGTGVADSHWRNNSQDSDNFSLVQWNECIPNQYSLKPDQLMQMEDVLYDCRAEMLPLEKKLSRLELDAQLYNDNPEVQPDQIKSYQRRINDVKDKLATLQAQANTKISNLLRNEQRAYFGTDFDWCNLESNGRMTHGRDIGAWCRWDSSQQIGKGYRGYGGYDGCCQ